VSLSNHVALLVASLQRSPFGALLYFLILYAVIKKLEVTSANRKAADHFEQYTN